MEVTFVGTGSGKTLLNRFHTSLLIKSKNHTLLIDTGDGISKALLSSNIDITKIDTIFITHTHADHFSGIASLLTQMKMAQRIKPLNFYIHSSFVNFVRNLLFSSFLFPETFNFEFKILGFGFKTELKIDDFKVLPFQNSHIINKYDIKYIPNINFVSSSLLISSSETSIHYTSDVGSLMDLSLFNEFKPKYLIVESTHIPISQIIEFLNNSHIKKAYLVHINDEDRIMEKHAELSNEIKNRLFLTNDGMRATMS